jgi:hypothetical protein
MIGVEAVHMCCGGVDANHSSLLHKIGQTHKISYDDDDQEV